MRQIQPTCGSICRLTTMPPNMLQWSRKKELGQPVVAVVPLVVVICSLHRFLGGLTCRASATHLQLAVEDTMQLPEVSKALARCR